MCCHWILPVSNFMLKPLITFWYSFPLILLSISLVSLPQICRRFPLVCDIACSAIRKSIGFSSLILHWALRRRWWTKSLCWKTENFFLVICVPCSTQAATNWLSQHFDFNDEIFEKAIVGKIMLITMRDAIRRVLRGQTTLSFKVALQSAHLQQYGQWIFNEVAWGSSTSRKFFINVCAEHHSPTVRIYL